MSYHDSKKMKEWEKLWQDAQDKFKNLTPAKPEPASFNPRMEYGPGVPESQRSEEPQVFTEDRSRAPSHREIFKWAQNVDRIFSKKNEAATNIQRDDGEDLPAIVKKMTQSDYELNPVTPNSLGPDNALRVSNFADGDALRELSSLKIQLHNLQDKFNSAMAIGSEKEENNLQKEVENLRSKVEELSNKLAPHPIKSVT